MSKAAPKEVDIAAQRELQKTMKKGMSDLSGKKITPGAATADGEEFAPFYKGEWAGMTQAEIEAELGLVRRGDKVVATRKLNSVHNRSTSAGGKP